MFDPVSSKTDLAALERETLAFWKERRIFEKSVEQRKDGERYIFHDGPPFATGLPHYGHLLAGTIKDIIPRYWAMRGFHVPRRFGWDCHGLPVENEAAKDLMANEGLDRSGKYEIEDYGISKFNEYCRSIVLRYTKEWEVVVTRMGRWVDFKNGYHTMDRDFMESIWWVFRSLWDKGLVYQGYRVMPFSWKLSTPLSNFEANMNYQTVQDPAITARFAVDGEENTYLLAWTTTPWTLPSNLGLAVGEDLDYLLVTDRSDGKRYYLAEARADEYQKKTKHEFEVIERMKGADLVGKTYTPLFPFFAGLKEEGAFRVIPSGHVTTTDGTGIVHMAPAFGEEDYEACRREKMPFVDPVDMEGRFTEPVSDFAGMNVKEADKHIIRKLKDEGKLLLHETYEHSYPFCWRSNTPLIYKAIKAWFVKVEAIKDRMIVNNNTVDWVPEAVGANRFGKWLENARDWNISRNRYWGTPIPIWVHEESGDAFALGSVAELEELTGAKVDDLHSHHIDHLTIEKDGKTYKRISEVFDCWFESGSMPYGQSHFPFADGEDKPNVPADFIAEGLDQTRGWFYTLMVLSTALFDKPAFKNVVVNGMILAADGNKMSKSKKNYPDPMKVIETYGADCVRSYMINSPAVRAEPLKFQEEGIQQIYRSVVSPLWNAYSFFITYARLDNYQPSDDLTSSTNELDQWILSHFQSLVADVAKHMEHNHLYSVVPELEEFIDFLTNWYIRRSRRRFWRAGDDGDKAAAYNTLYYVLVEFSKVMAPFLPFITESIYRNLTSRGDHPESVHLCDYPQPVASLIHPRIEEEMDYVRNLVELGRSLRSAHNLKVRQPLSKLEVVADQRHAEMLDRLGDIVREELNVKAIEYLPDETELVHYSARPNLRALGPRLGKHLKELNPAIRNLEHAQIAELLEKGSLEVAGHQLTPDDLLLDRNEKENLVVLSEGGITIALDTRITPELELEGDARELVNRVQNLRKEAGFNVEDRIHIRVEADGWLPGCIQKHGAYIKDETLASSLNEGSFEPELEKEWEVNGKKVHIALARV
jgi:isoleucyl-tRNA synthetase